MWGNGWRKRKKKRKCVLEMLAAEFDCERCKKIKELSGDYAVITLRLDPRL